MFKFLNPYYYLGAAIVLALIGGTFYYQDRQIHHYHTLFDNEHTKTIQLQDQLNVVLARQADQSTKTTQNVTKVVTVPGPVQTVVKTIHDAPEPVDCSTPPLSDEVKNAF